jgi:hypothetical protein
MRIDQIASVRIANFNALDFWTRSKKITAKWSNEYRSNWMS